MAITAETGLRLSCYFGNTAEFWLNLQTHDDLQIARNESGKAILLKVKPPERSRLTAIRGLHPCLYYRTVRISVFTRSG